MIALVGWIVLYALVFWIAVLLHPTLEGSMPDARAVLIPFTIWAIILVIVTAVLDRAYPHARRVGEKFFRPFTVLEALLFVPQLTVTAAQNLRAFVFLNRQEMQTAWQLAQLVAQDKFVALETIHAHFTDAALLNRALTALEHLGILQRHPEGAGWLLTMPNANARRICEPRVRLRV